MSCLKNFSLSVSLVRTYSTVGTNVKTWGVVGNQHWVVLDANLNTRKNIQGFKNINIYKIKMVGAVTPSLASNSAIIQDYSFRVQTNGLQSIIGGAITPNATGATENNQDYFLTKYISEIEFPDGITSPTSVELLDFYAQGNNAETPGNITLNINMDFVFYYEFEGE